MHTLAESLPGVAFSLAISRLGPASARPKPGLPARGDREPARLSALCRVKRNASCLILQGQVQLLRLVVQCCGYIYNQPLHIFVQMRKYALKKLAITGIILRLSI